MSSGKIKSSAEDSSSPEESKNLVDPAHSDTKLNILKTELLKKIPLFATLPEEDLIGLTEQSKNIVLAKDDILFEEGTTDRNMYIIISGNILIYKGKTLIKRVGTLGPSEYFGEMALIDGEPRSTSTKALTDTILAEIDQKDFSRYIASNHKTLMGMMKIFSSRVRADLVEMESDMKKISNFTHDMRNCLVPLGIAEAHLTDISKTLHGTEDGQKERIGYQKAQKSFDTMRSVKNNLLTLIDQSLACVKKVKTDYVKAEMEVIPLVRETVDEISCHKVLKDKNVRVYADGKIRKALFNYLDIKRVLQNLVINAGYVSKKNGDIEVHVKELDDNVQVSVKDYGSGVPEKVKPLLLRENYTSKPDGNGFGLMSCKEIIEEFHDGKIFFESEVGKGTTFHFTLGQTN